MRHKLRYLELLKKGDESLAAAYKESFVGKRANIATKTPDHFQIYSLDAKRDESLRYASMYQKNLSSTHKPLVNIFHFGIEIECLVPTSELDIRDAPEYIECPTCEGSGRLTYEHRDSGYTVEDECQACDGSGEIRNEDRSDNEEDAAVDAMIEYLSDRGLKGIAVKSDSSISSDDSDYAGIELAVLTHDFKNLEKLCEILNDMGARVNKSCGLHVHLDMRQRNRKEIEQVIANLFSAYPLLKSLVPKSRQNNEYCKDGKSITDRYRGVNLTALEKFGTIEIRLHSSTTDFGKITSWCKLLKSIIDSKNIVKDISTPYQARKILKLPRNLARWTYKRVKEVAA